MKMSRENGEDGFPAQQATSFAAAVNTLDASQMVRAFLSIPEKLWKALAGPIKAEIAKTRQEIRAKDKVEEASNKLDKPPPTTKLPTQYAKANTVDSERSLEERVEQMCVSNAYLTIPDKDL